MTRMVFGCLQRYADYFVPILQAALVPNLGVIAFGNLRNTLSQVAFTLILTKVDKAIWLALLKAH